MRRVVALGLVITAIGSGAAALPASGATHGPSAYRQSAAAYNRPGGVTLGTPSTLRTVSSPTAAGKALTGEDKVAITVKDNSNSAVALAISITPAGSTTATSSVACNAASIAVRAGTRVEVTPVAGLCPDGRVSTPRVGTVTLTWHRYLPAPTRTTPRGAAPSQRFAVLIGIRDYGGRTESTVGGTNDVNAIRAALLSSGWASANIRMVTDGAATADGIRNAMAWLASKSTSKSFSLLHFSGHVCIASRGPCAKGHTYLWSYDNKFLPESEVVARMKSVRGYQWLDVAGCEAGAFDAGYHAANRLFTASSRGSETSYEQPQWGFSVWTGIAWDKGFRSGYADSKGARNHATIYQFAGYGVRETPNYTRNQNAGVQHPVLAGGSSSWTLSAPPGG